jgi:hypothetical protein
MATITSKPQDDVISAFVQSTGPDSKKWMWIDGTNFASGGNQTEWYSLNSGKKLDFFNWVRERPVTGGDRHCLRWSSNSLDAGWWDVSCVDRHNVLCQVGVV